MKHILLVALLVAFSGQSLALVLPACAMGDAPMTSAMDSAVASEMDHAGHGHNHVTGPDFASDAAVDCCDPGGVCTMSHCLSSAAVAIGSLVPGAYLAATGVESRTPSSNAGIASLPFRPPIIR